MRLWYGKKRLALKFIGWDRKILAWAMSVKPGDFIATCEGCNRRVTEVQPKWANEGYWKRGKPNRTWIVHEVQFTDSHGRWHYCPGGGCAYPKQTPAEVTAYYRHIALDKPNIAMEKDWGWFDRFERIRQALRTGAPIVDEFGEFLPEFDHHGHS